MKKCNILFATILVVSALVSCSRFKCEEGKGDFVLTEKDISSFTDLKVSGDFEVILKQEDTYSCKIETYENLTSLIEVRNSGRALEIDSKKCINGKKRNKIYISAPDISYMKFSGAINAISENTFKVQSLTLKGSGSCGISMDIETENLDISVSGSSDIILKGQSDNLSFDVSGSGSLNAADLKATTASIRISGAGDCNLHVENSLRANISGSGNVKYSGSPAEVSSKISGSGSISKVSS
jgi:hypothetical protein